MVKMPIYLHKCFFWQIGIEIEHGDVPDEGEEGYEGDDAGEKEAEQDDEVDDVIIVGKYFLRFLYYP